MCAARRVFSGTQCRAIDRIAIDEYQIPSFELISRAGQFANQALQRHFSTAERIAVICGHGNNAADGYVLANELARDGRHVNVVQIGDIERLQGGALMAWEALDRDAVEVSDQLDGEFDLLVDALLGTGTQGAIREPYAALIDAVNARPEPVVALDLPSGVDPETGGLLIPEPIHATLTVTFVAEKLALHTGPAVNFRGKLAYSDLGISSAVFERVEGIPTIPSGATRLKLPERRLGAYKTSLGHVLVIGGNVGTGGAVLLASQAALRSGSGLVSCITHPQHVSAVLERYPEVMVSGVDDSADIAHFTDRVDVLAIGPGLGRDSWAENLLAQALASKLPTILDADALNLLATTPRELPRRSVLTPHPGEAARLLGVSVPQIESDRISAAIQIANKFGATAVLKGAGTIIAGSNGGVALCAEALPVLATGGSGDVLAGIAAVCLAQLQDPNEAARTAVALHVAAGERLIQADPAVAYSASQIADSIRPWG